MSDPSSEDRDAALSATALTRKLLPLLARTFPQLTIPKVIITLAERPAVFIIYPLEDCAKQQFTFGMFRPIIALLDKEQNSQGSPNRDWVVKSALPDTFVPHALSTRDDFIFTGMRFTIVPRWWAKGLRDA